MSRNLLAISLILTLPLFSDDTIITPEATTPPQELLDTPQTQPSLQPASTPQTCLPSPSLYRTSIQHREHQGIGYKTGYTSLDFFLPYWDNGSTYLFIDARGHLFNNGKWATNAGLGLRYLSNERNVVFGANLYYDFRQAEHRGSFNQVGGGIEVLGKVWDFRANTYWPVGKTVQYGRPGSMYFQGHHALLKRRAEYAMHGGNAEVGANFLTRENFKGHLALGGYYFNSSRLKKKAAGPTVRLTADITPYMTLEGQYSYDSLFKNIVQGMISLNIPFGPKAKTSASSRSCNTNALMQQRLVEPVQRFEIIVEKDKKQTFYALNPLTGDPLNFIFVNNLAPDADGTIEHPYPTLALAQDNSNPGDVIYVFAGDGSTTGMDAGITLKENQWLLGSGHPFTFNTDIGPQVLAAQTTNSPTITNSNHIIQTSDNNIINGINIDIHTIHHAIRTPSDLMTNLTISNNNIIASGAAIGQATGFFAQIIPISGTIEIANNSFSNLHYSLDIESEGTYKVDILNNSFLDDAVDAIHLEPTGTGTASVTISQNTFQTTSASPTYAIVQVNGGVGIDYSILDNIISSDVSQASISLTATGSTLIKNNTITAQGGAHSIQLISTNPGLTSVVKNNQLISGEFVILGNNAKLKIVDNTSPGTTAFYTLTNTDGNMAISSPDGTVAGGTYGQNNPLNVTDSFDFPNGDPTVYPTAQTSGDNFP